MWLEFYFDEREREAETAMIIRKLEGKEAACEIFTARGSRGGERNHKLRKSIQRSERKPVEAKQLRSFVLSLRLNTI